jgi:signal transduction histidine kinase
VNRHGLGLISMRETLHLVSGKISIKSQPGEAPRSVLGCLL